MKARALQTEWVDFDWLLFTIPVCLLLSSAVAILLFVFIEKLQGAKAQSDSDASADAGPIEEALKRARPESAAAPVVALATDTGTPGDGVTCYVQQSSPRFPSELLIAHNARDKQYFDVYRVDGLTGAELHAGSTGLAGVSYFNTPIVAKGRVFVAGSRVYAFRP